LGPWTTVIGIECSVVAIPSEAPTTAVEEPASEIPGERNTRPVPVPFSDVTVATVVYGGPLTMWKRMGWRSGSVALSVWEAVAPVVTVIGEGGETDGAVLGCPILPNGRPSVSNQSEPSFSVLSKSSPGHLDPNAVIVGYPGGTGGTVPVPVTRAIEGEPVKTVTCSVASL
jgi:hypothetical protein